MQHAHDTPSRRNKAVSFAPTATMKLALHIDDYTTEEWDSTYYSREDFHAFQQDAMRAVFILETMEESEIDCDDETISVRGLEGHTKAGFKLKTKIRKAAKCAVFKEQIDHDIRLEQEDGDVDVALQQLEKKIADVYTSMTRKSARAAYARGLADEEVAISLQRENIIQRTQSECRQQRPFHGKNLDNEDEALSLLALQKIEIKNKRGRYNQRKSICRIL